MGLECVFVAKWDSFIGESRCFAAVLRCFESGCLHVVQSETRCLRTSKDVLHFNYVPVSLCYCLDGSGSWPLYQSQCVSADNHRDVCVQTGVTLCRCVSKPIAPRGNSAKSFIFVCGFCVCISVDKWRDEDWYPNVNISRGALGPAPSRSGNRAGNSSQCDQRPDSRQAPPTTLTLFLSFPLPSTLPAAPIIAQSSQACVRAPMALLLIIPESCRSYWSRPTGDPSLCWLLPLQTQLPPLMVNLHAPAAPRLKQFHSLLARLETFRLLQCCSLLPSSALRVASQTLLNSPHDPLYHAPWRSLS